MKTWNLILICSVEIIRLSDKTYKDTIKDIEITPQRSTTKEGYISLDPSKPLPHEYEERTRYGNSSVHARRNAIFSGLADSEITVTTVNEAVKSYFQSKSEYAAATTADFDEHTQIEQTAIDGPRDSNINAMAYVNETIEKLVLLMDDENSLKALTDEAIESDKLTNGGKKWF